MGVFVCWAQRVWEGVTLWEGEGQVPEEVEFLTLQIFEAGRHTCLACSTEWLHFSVDGNHP